jgi:hypothetical protein
MQNQVIFDTPQTLLLKKSRRVLKAGKQGGLSHQVAEFKTIALYVIHSINEINL